MRFAGRAYRAIDPKWSFGPLSGEGAALRGARFNPPGVPALYLSLDPVTALNEVAQGFAGRYCWHVPSWPNLLRPRPRLFQSRRAVVPG